MASHWDSNQGQKKKKKGENERKGKKKKQPNINWTDSDCTHALINPHNPTHVIGPYKNADTQTPLDAQIHKHKCLYNTEIKFRVQLAIRASQTQFPLCCLATSRSSPFPCERMGSVSSHKHYPLLPHPSPLSQWMDAERWCISTQGWQGHQGEKINTISHL